MWLHLLVTNKKGGARRKQRLSFIKTLFLQDPHLHQTWQRNRVAQLRHQIRTRHEQRGQKWSQKWRLSRPRVESQQRLGRLIQSEEEQFQRAMLGEESKSTGSSLEHFRETGMKLSKEFDQMGGSLVCGTQCERGTLKLQNFLPFRGRHFTTVDINVINRHADMVSCLVQGK